MRYKYAYKLVPDRDGLRICQSKFSYRTAAAAFDAGWQHLEETIPAQDQAAFLIFCIDSKGLVPTAFEHDRKTPIDGAAMLKRRRAGIANCRRAENGAVAS